jgi:hypothetical protein
MTPTRRREIEYLKQKGVEAAEVRKPISSCPPEYSTKLDRKHWEEGYRSFEKTQIMIHDIVKKWCANCSADTCSYNYTNPSMQERVNGLYRSYFRSNTPIKVKKLVRRLEKGFPCFIEKDTKNKRRIKMTQETMISLLIVMGILIGLFLTAYLITKLMNFIYWVFRSFDRVKTYLKNRNKQ